MAGLIVETLALILLSAPLIFGLQRFGVFKPSLWMVSLTCLWIAFMLTLAFGDNTALYIGYVAIPLLAIGLVVLAASFFSKKRVGQAAGSAAETSQNREA